MAKTRQDPPKLASILRDQIRPTETCKDLPQPTKVYFPFSPRIRSSLRVSVGFCGFKCFKGASRELLGCFEGVSRVFEAYFKGVLRVF